MSKIKLLLVSIAPPRNDCGVRIVMHRHFVERTPFELHVISNADFAEDLLIHTKIRLPYPLFRMQKSRFGPKLRKWLIDYENFVWPFFGYRSIDRAVKSFKPDVILVLAETGLCHMGAKVAKKHGIPLAGLFLDWFPIMPPHFGHFPFQGILSNRYKRLYGKCDLAICTSDGMKEELGAHPNAHVVYPMPGKHCVPSGVNFAKKNRFRLVYVGSAQGFYGRMLRQLWQLLRSKSYLELIIVGPSEDWPESELSRAKADGTCLGFMPPENASEVLAGADALLVVMSFEEEQALFMRTSFTTKFLDYTAFGKPIILWGPEYCTPVKVAKKEKAAMVVEDSAPEAVVEAIERLSKCSDSLARLSISSKRLHQGLFCPERLQKELVGRISEIVKK